MKRFLNYLLQGLILFIPLIITWVILLQLFNFFAGLFSFIGFSEYPILNALLGLLGTLSFVLILGILASSYIFKPVFSFFEDKLEHAPFIRHIYSPLKDFTNAFVGNKKKFNKPVLVRTNVSADIYEVGFITKEDLKDFKISDKVAVYLPYAYSLSGKVVIVPLHNITPLEADAADAMKFVLSGGVTDVD